LLIEKAQAKQYKTLLESLQHEKKQLETKVGEMQKTVAQSEVNANSDGKLDKEKLVQLS
jgi:prefoldin subunit 5